MVEKDLGERSEKNRALLKKAMTTGNFWGASEFAGACCADSAEEGVKLVIEGLRARNPGQVMRGVLELALIVGLAPGIIIEAMKVAFLAQCLDRIGRK